MKFKITAEEKQMILKRRKSTKTTATQQMLLEIFETAQKAHKELAVDNVLDIIDGYVEDLGGGLYGLPTDIKEALIIASILRHRLRLVLFGISRNNPDKKFVRRERNKLIIPLNDSDIETVL